MLFPPRSVGSALGGLKKKFDLISLKKNPNPPCSGLFTPFRFSVLASSVFSMMDQTIDSAWLIQYYSCYHFVFILAVSRFRDW
jgi:hypothetical protein